MVVQRRDLKVVAVLAVTSEFVNVDVDVRCSRVAPRNQGRDLCSLYKAFWKLFYGLKSSSLTGLVFDINDQVCIETPKLLLHRPGHDVFGHPHWRSPDVQYVDTAIYQVEFTLMTCS